MTEIPLLTNKCLRGATIGRLTDFITFMTKEDRNKLTAACIILHIGTNNVVPGTTVTQVGDQFQILIQLIQWYFPGAKIYCSAILPRPCDSWVTSFFVKTCNELFCIIAAKHQCIFIPSYKGFTQQGQIKTFLYTPSDFLHLNGLGLAVLSSLFREYISKNNVDRMRKHTFDRATKLSAKLNKRGYPKLP